jgi:hypothetical protein
MQQESHHLSAEMREIREIRALLRTVRDEAGRAVEEARAAAAAPPQAAALGHLREVCAQPSNGVMANCSRTKNPLFLFSCWNTGPPCLLAYLSNTVEQHAHQSAYCNNDPSTGKRIHMECAMVSRGTFQ